LIPFVFAKVSPSSKEMVLLDYNNKIPIFD
jgi:hypothetical protein